MTAFVLKNKGELEKSMLFATNAADSYIQEAGFKVKKLESGPLGGDSEIATTVVNNKLDIVIFFIDPLGKHPHEPDLQVLISLCDVHNIPLVTNPAAADLIIKNIE